MIVLNTLTDRFMEGGPLFMSLILICLLVSILFLVLGFKNLNKNDAQTRKMTRLASDLSLLGLVLGFLGSILGMITAFDAMELGGLVSSEILAAGLKVSFLTTLFGSITFILVRIGIIFLRAMRKTA